VARLRREVDTLQQEVATVNEHRTAMAHQLQAAEVNLNKERDRANEAEKEVSRSHANLEQERMYRAQANAQLQQAVAEANNAMHRVTQLEGELTNTRSILERENNGRQQAGEIVRNLEHEINALRGQNQQLQGQLQETNWRHSMELQKEVQRRELELRDARVQMDAMRRRAEGLAMLVQLNPQGPNLPQYQQRPTPSYQEPPSTLAPLPTASPNFEYPPQPQDHKQSLRISQPMAQDWAESNWNHVTSPMPPTRKPPTFVSPNTPNQPPRARSSSPVVARAVA